MSLTTKNWPKVVAPAPVVRFFTKSVPAAVPSVFQSSSPFVPSSAVKKTVSVPEAVWVMKLRGFELAVPDEVLMSFNREVFAPVPLLRYSSLCVPSNAPKTTLLPILTGNVALELPDRLICFVRVAFRLLPVETYNSVFPAIVVVKNTPLVVSTKPEGLESPAPGLMSAIKSGVAEGTSRDSKVSMSRRRRRGRLGMAFRSLWGCIDGEFSAGVTHQSSHGHPSRMLTERGPIYQTSNRKSLNEDSCICPRFNEETHFAEPKRRS